MPCQDSQVIYLNEATFYQRQKRFFTHEKIVQACGAQEIHQKGKENKYGITTREKTEIEKEQVSNSPDNEPAVLELN